MDSYIEVTGTARAQETARELYAYIEVEVRAAPKAGAGSTATELRNTVVRALRAAGMRDDVMVEGGEGIASLEPLSTDKRTNIDVRMPSPRFEGTDESKAQARAAALRDARAKADALAAEAGVRITSVLRIEELDGHEQRGYRSDHGVLYSHVAYGSFEHEELSAATRDVEYAFRLRFAIEPSPR